MEDLVHLPKDHKFTLYLGENGEYTLESQQERGLVIHGPTPDLVFIVMAGLLPIWESFKEWCKSCGCPIEFDPVETIMPTFENFQEMTRDPEDTLTRQLKRAYSDPAFCREALKLNKEFEVVQMEVLGRSESDAGQ